MTTDPTPHGRPLLDAISSLLDEFDLPEPAPRAGESTCAHCGEPIHLAPDPDRWVHPDDRERCRTTYATPVTSGAADATAVPPVTRPTA